MPLWISTKVVILDLRDLKSLNMLTIQQTTRLACLSIEKILDRFGITFAKYRLVSETLTYS